MLSALSRASRSSHLVVVMAALASFACLARAEVGVVSHITVLSNHVDDVSSIKAWEKSFIKEGMTDKEKALAIWRTVVAFQHQDAPPSEFLQLENNVQDPIKLFNVYGYSFCSVTSAHVQALARHAGLKARGWTISRHVVPEILWDGKWHLLDASLINYFFHRDGSIAGVEEIVADCKAWYAAHPGYKGNDARLRQFMANGGWRNGPDLLRNCPFYGPQGWLPAATHGWYSTMQEYDGSTLFPYESGYSMGYQVNVQLRPGERLVRNWSNRGLHVMMDGGGTPGCLKGTVGKGALRYTPDYGDLANGRIGNGVREYALPLASGAFRSGMLAATNLACTADDGHGPAIRVKDPAQPATLIFRMPSSYVYLTGTLALDAVVGPGGSIAISLSTNNGLDWTPLVTLDASGPQTLDLKPHVFRRYDYRLKAVLKGKGTGLNALKVTHDVQHSQRPLPALVQGTNTITFRAAPPEGTVTIEGTTDPKNKGRQLHYTDFHPVCKNIRKNGLLVLAAGTGEVVYPITTPGDLTRIRIGVYYRARDKRDAWDVAVSFDGGKTYTSLGRCEGPTRNHGKTFVVADVPPATRSALVRFAGTQHNTTMLYQTRIDADYREPHGGFRPVMVTYAWTEDGAAKRHVHTAKAAEETYTITCAGKPAMKGLTVELAD
ncbi:hypothetical protein HQ576_05790 [bacterium]|nr:hypothetical protein [bacterium]